MRRALLTAFIGCLYASCASDGKFAMIIPEQTDPIVLDGMKDETWDAYPVFEINEHWWGKEPESKADLSGYFKIFRTKEKLFFFIKIYDDTQYTHSIPLNTIDRPLWDSDDYDKINVSLIQNETTYKFGLNYNSDLIFGKGAQCKDIKYEQFSADNGYSFEVVIPLEKVDRQGNFVVLIAVYDNDARFNRMGMDVFSERESIVGCRKLFTLTNYLE